MFLVSLDVSIANVTLPAMSKSFPGSGRAALSWVICAYAIAFAAALVPGGRLADRAGRRIVFLSGFALFAVGSLICGLAPSLPVAIGGRIVQGVGAAAGQPASLGLLLAAAGSERRAQTAARWGGTGAIGIALGPVLGGAITTALGWRWAYLVNLPVVAIVACMAPAYLAETARHPGRRLPDPVGAVMLAAGAALLTLGISEGPTWGWSSWRTAVAVAAGVLATAVFVHRCRRVPDPLLDLRLLGRRSFALVTVVTVFYSAAFFGLLFSFVLFLTDVWRLSLVDCGLAIAPMALVVVILSMRVGGLSERVGFRLPLRSGAVLICAGLLLDAAVLGDPRMLLFPWLPVVMLIGLGIGLCYPLLSAAAVSEMPTGELASATAVNQCARQLGAALGVAAAVAALGAATPAPVADFHLAWLVGAGFALIAALAAAALPSGRRRRADERLRADLDRAMT
jgi:EmrB/QacA subfamily drug resistance transporter